MIYSLLIKLYQRSNWLWKQFPPIYFKEKFKDRPARPTNPTEAHNNANRFASLVGDELKRQFPSRILDPDVELRVYKQDGQKFYRLTWSCRIVPASIQDADYYFDRRGSMLPGSTIEEARQKIQDQIMTSRKISSMRLSFQTAIYR